MIHAAAVVKSATGEHMTRIMEATDFEIELESPAFRHAYIRGEQIEETIFLANLDVELSAIDINLQGHVPRQIAAKLREWSRHLAKLADKVSRVPPQTLKLEPRAHIVRNIITGDTYEGSPFADLAHEELVELHQATGDGFEIISGPLGEWPEQQEAFVAIVANAINEATDPK